MEKVSSPAQLTEECDLLAISIIAHEKVHEEFSNRNESKRIDFWKESGPLKRAMWMFPKIGVFPPKWMVKIRENPSKMDDLGVHLFLETPLF